jgi:hypothetical protein
MVANRVHSPRAFNPGSCALSEAPAGNGRATSPTGSPLVDLFPAKCPDEIRLTVDLTEPSEEHLTIPRWAQTTWPDVASSEPTSIFCCEPPQHGHEHSLGSTCTLLSSHEPRITPEGRGPGLL